MTGTVRRKGKDKKKWILTLNFGYNSLGKQNRKTKTVTAENKSDAQRQLQIFMKQYENYQIDQPETTVEAFAEDWMRKYAEMRNLAPRTVDTYRRALNNYVYPLLGPKRLTDVTALMLSDFFSHMLNEKKADIKQRRSLDKKLNPLTVKRVYYLLCQIFRAAYQWDQIAVNPMDKLNPPRGKVQSPKTFSVAILQSIDAALKKEPMEFQLLVRLAITTGCREDELLALSWNDYDEIRHTFYIHQTIQYTPEKGIFIFPNTKTESSKRYIFIVPQMLDSLLEAQKQMIHIKKYAGPQWNPANLVFFSDDGSPIRPNTLSNQFTDFIRKNNIPHLRFHDLRGFFATQLMMNGYSLADVIKKTGHSRASTLLDYYGHALEENEEAMNKTIIAAFDVIQGHASS